MTIAEKIPLQMELFTVTHSKDIYRWDWVDPIQKASPPRAPALLIIGDLCPLKQNLQNYQILILDSKLTVQICKQQTERLETKR